MKKMIHSFLVSFMIVGFVSVAYAREPFLRVKKRGSKEFFLFIDKAELRDGPTVIRLKDLKGNSLHKEAIRSDEDYTKVFNLDALSRGFYFLEIEDQAKINTWSLKVGKGGLVLEKSGELEFFKPKIISRSNNKFDISMFNALKHDIELEIFNDHNDLVFTDDITDELSVQKRYNLSQLQIGTYTVSIKVDGKIFNETVAVN